MAEIVEGSNIGTNHEHKEYASNAKANAGLTLGIIGTSLAGLTALGGMAGASKIFGNTSTSSQGSDNASCMTSEDLYIERQQAQNYIDLTKEYYQGKLDSQKQLADAFFDAYQRDVDNSFMLYKNQRDNYDALNQKIIDSSFGLYKNQRDEKDAIMASQYAMKDTLNDKIASLQSQVDVMAAIRPYQDALINAKIDKNALLSDFKLAKRTCRMIEGTLMLPDTLTSGFTSANYSDYE